MSIISITIFLLYLFLIGAFAYGFDKVPISKLENASPKTKFSIVIPFRNEANNLDDLLKSITALKYPNHLFEIIFVDDDSNDNSVEIIKKHLKSELNISIIKNKRASNSPKKDAITTAITHSKNEWIITTDADCILPNLWLNSFDEFIQKTKTICIAAPVTYSINKSFLNKFQLLDILSLQGATIGGFGIKKPFLCNGANFGYKKSIFKELHGFNGNTDTASGDDIFLLEKITKKHPNRVNYLKSKNAIVLTQAQPSLQALLSQRIRWAAKTSAYNNWFGKLTGLIVLLANTLIVSLCLLSILSIFNYKALMYLAIIKFNIDFLLIYKSATFFNQKSILKSFILGFFIYPFFSTYIAIISMFTGYKWKGRSFKK